MQVNPLVFDSMLPAPGSRLLGLNTNSLLSPAQQQQKAKETAQDFEAMFVQLSLKEMRPKLEGGLFNHGLAEDVFYQFMDEAIAKEISKSENNFGIADAMLEQGI